jgi:hypothetical protein
MENKKEKLIINTKKETKKQYKDISPKPKQVKDKINSPILYSKKGLFIKKI